MNTDIRCVIKLGYLDAASEKLTLSIGKLRPVLIIRFCRKTCIFPKVRNTKKTLVFSTSTVIHGVLSPPLCNDFKK